jgi:MoaA/NifB/PqqE/SkfB family radical SAM enzyme
METNKIKLKMSKDGLIAYEPLIPLTIRFNREETVAMVKKAVDFDKFDDVCEIAHLEVSNQCNLKCKYCYVGEKKSEELPVNQWKTIIDKLVDYGIFQITFGGGEPTLYSGFLELAAYAKTKNLNVGMTTNGTTLHKFKGNILKQLFRQINISWHQNKTDFIDAIEFLFDNEIKTGINYCYSKDMAEDNEYLKSTAKHFGAELLYLAYKPVIGDYDNLITPGDIYKIAKIASDEGIRVAVDGPCAGQCMMKKKFIDVNHKGDVFPCSFVRNSMGNLLTSDLKTIWRERGEQDKCPYVEIAKEVVSG